MNNESSFSSLLVDAQGRALSPAARVGDPSSTSPPSNRGRPPRLVTELGFSGLRSYQGTIDEEFLTQLKGIRGVQVYTEMSNNDAVVGGILQMMLQTMRGVHFAVETSGTSNEEQEARKFTASCFNDMSITFQDVLSEVLTTPVFGWAYMEKVFKQRRGQTTNPRTHSKFNDGLFGWRKIVLRGQNTLDKWELDSEGGIQGMHQQATFTDSGRAAGADGAYIPIEKAILFRTSINKNNPEGKSVLRNAYRSWYFKKYIEEILAIGVSRDLVGLPTFTPPEGFKLDAEENTSLVASVKQTLRRIKRDEQEGLLVPSGWEFKLVSSPGERQFNVLEVLTYFDKRIAMTTLGQFIMLGLERVGSFALSKNQSNLFLMSLGGYLTSITENFNRFGVDELLQLNGWGDLDSPPQLSYGNIEAPTMDEISNYVTRLAKVQAITPTPELEELLLKLGGLTELPERSSIVREAGKNGQSHATVRSTEERTKTIDNKGNTGDANGESKGEGEFVPITSEYYLFGTEDRILSSHYDLAQGFEAAKQIGKNNLHNKLFLSKVTGSYSNGALQAKVIYDFIPLSQVEKNDEYFLDWVKGRTNILFNPNTDTNENRNGNTNEVS